tara:strand:- start:2100 stop:2558 length:459 start_codon:yes stop_codon:yes gene_type:complete
MEQLTKKQSKGLEYESFIMDWFCENKKINLSHYTTTNEQFFKGENRQGVEIKNDQKFAETGNLFISVERDYGYKKYPSGIYKDQSWLYVIGNKEIFYIFATKHLKQYYEKHTPNLFNGFVSNKNGTDKGFLLNTKLADRICIQKITKQTKLF